MGFLLTITAASLLLALPAVARATTYYAAPGTTNTTDCTTPQTACEIHFAIGTAPQANGDQVIVLPGTYDAGSAGIVATKAITIQGQPGSPMPEIDGSTVAAGVAGALLVVDGGAGTVVDDLKLVESGNNGPPAAVGDVAGGARFERVCAETTPTATGNTVVLGDGTVLADSVAWARGGGAAVFLGLPVSARVENVTAYRILGAGPDIGAYELSLPVVTTGSPQTSGLAATLTGTVNPEALLVSACTFEYGTSTSYGASIPCAQDPGSGVGAVAVSALLGGLQAGTTYRYRLVATDADASTAGQDQVFTTPTGPIEVSPPMMSGSGLAGAPLLCAPGAWLGSPTFAFAWLRDGQPIAGGVGNSYTPTGADADRAIQCQVTATNVVASVVALSAATAVPGLPATANPPALNGTARPGHTLTCTPGSWSGTPTFTYAWLRDGVAIRGANATQYLVKRADSGHAVQCQVTATGAGGSVLADSAAKLVGRAATTVAIVTGWPGVSATGQTALLVACQGIHGRCAGALVLTHGTMRLAGAHFSLPAGRQRFVPVQLNQAAMALMDHRPGERLPAVASAPGTTRKVVLYRRVSST